MPTRILTPAIALALATALLAQSRPPLRVDGFIQERKLISAPAPVYPKPAIQAHITGTVRLAVLIGEDGAVDRIRLISGHPFLVKAAMDAVKQWEYEPNLWDGVPVAVLTTVDVHFSLGPLKAPPNQPGRKETIVHATLTGD